MPHTYKSSFRFTTLTIISKQDFRRAKHIISHIIENPESLQFRQPVNWQGLNLLDYPQIIKDPMDLGTILQKINDQVYQHVQEFLDDFQLIWDNCKTYNVKGTWIYGLADKLEKNGKKMLKNYFPTIPILSVKNLQTNQPLPQPIIQQSSGNQSAQNFKQSKSKKQEKTQRPPKTQKNQKLYYEDEQEISMAEKMRLADKFKSLSPQQNQEVVQNIKICCPTAFREQEETVQILVDNMDIITFKQIMEKIQEIEQGGQGSAPGKRVKFN